MTSKNGAKTVRAPLLTISEAAAQLGVSRMQVYRLIHLRLLGHLDLPGTASRSTFRIPQEELDRFKAQHFKAATT